MSSLETILSIVIATCGLFVIKPVYLILIRRISPGLGVVKENDLQKLSNDFWTFLMHTLMFISMVVVADEKKILWPAFTPWGGEELKVLYPSDSPDFYSRETWATAFQISFLISDSYYAVIENHPDRIEKAFHHLTTIFLIVMGMVVNFHNSSIVVMLIHKIAEPLLFFGKTAVILQWDKLSTGLFVCFILVWIPSRLFIFPYWIYLVYVTPLPWSNRARDISTVFLCLLLCLHVYWTYLIYRVLMGMLTKGKITKEMDNSFKKDDLSEVKKTK